jgi:hypothetical protein
MRQICSLDQCSVDNQGRGAPLCMPDYHAPSLRCFSETDLGVRSDRRDELGRAGVRPECSRHQGTNVCRVLRKLRPNIERYDSDRLGPVFS